MKPRTLGEGMEAVAQNLRESGYPDATATMIREAYSAWVRGARGSELPHGIVGMFAQAQFEHYAKFLTRLPQ